MTKILHFNNQDGTFNDFSESVLTISPEGTKVEQHLHPQKPVEENAAPKDKEKKKGLTISQLARRFFFVYSKTFFKLSSMLPYKT